MKKDALLALADVMNLSTRRDQTVGVLMGLIIERRAEMVEAEDDPTISLPNKRGPSIKEDEKQDAVVTKDDTKGHTTDDEEPTAAQTSQEDEGEAQALAALALDEEEEQPVAVEAH